MIRRLGRWAREVVTAQELGAPVPLELEHSDGGYAFRVGLRAGFGGHHEARIPVRRQTNPAPHPILKEIHSCEVAGIELQAANVFALRHKAAAQLEAIAPGGSLPLCWFRSPQADYELPVYEDGGEIVCPVLGGRRLKAGTLSAMRREVTRHLLSAGYVTDPEEVEVGVLQPRDLRRVAPVAVLRSLDDPEMWLPCVEGVSPEGPVVGVIDHGFRLGAAGRRRGGGPAETEAVPVAPDVLGVLRSVQAEVERATGTPSSLFACDVQLHAWQAAAASTEDAGARLVAHLDDSEQTRLELELRRTGAHDFAVAVEDRGINVFLAPDVDALAALVARRLRQSGFLRHERDVEVAPVTAPRPERLDADSIWTHAETPPAGAEGIRLTEEAHA